MVPSDDGGLGEALQKEERRQAAEEKAARAREVRERHVRELRRERAQPIKAALADQDVQVEKAVRAFLSKVHDTAPTDSVTVRWKPPPRSRFWQPAYAPSPIDRPAYRIFRWRWGEADDAAWQIVLLTIDGVVALDLSDAFGPNQRAEFPRVEWLNGKWVRKPLAPGRLPFYYASDFANVPPLAIGPADLVDIELPIATIERTTRWFVDVLARFLHNNG